MQTKTTLPMKKLVAAENVNLHLQAIFAPQNSNFTAHNYRI